MRANSQQVGFCFRHTFIYSLFCNICFISYSQKCIFFAIYSSIRRLQWFQRGWQRPNAGRRRGREEAKGEWSEGAKEKRKGAKEKRGRARIERKASEGEERKERSEGERALVASVVHVARALYMNVTQDVAVGLSCILCTPTLDYTEYHARLRSIILNTIHDSDWFFYIRFTIRTDLLEFLLKLQINLHIPKILRTFAVAFVRAHFCALAFSLMFCCKKPFCSSKV